MDSHGDRHLGMTNSTTTIHNTSFTMRTSVSKDLAIKRNTDGAKVTWTYIAGHDPGVIWEKMWHVVMGTGT